MQLGAEDVVARAQWLDGVDGLEPAHDTTGERAPVHERLLVVLDLPGGVALVQAHGEVSEGRKVPQYEVLRRQVDEGRRPLPVHRAELQRLDVDGEHDVVLHVLEDDVVADDAHVVDDAVDEALHVARRHLHVLPPLPPPPLPRLGPGTALAGGLGPGRLAPLQLQDAFWRRECGF